MGCKAIFLLGGLLAATLTQAATPAELPAAASALLTAWPKDRTATAYVAQAWAKLRTPAGTAAVHRRSGLASATLDLATPGGGVVLARIGRQGTSAFVEAGRAQLVEHLAPREPRIFELGEGHAYSRTDAPLFTIEPFFVGVGAIRWIAFARDCEAAG